MAPTISNVYYIQHRKNPNALVAFNEDGNYSFYNKDAQKIAQLLNDALVDPSHFVVPGDRFKAVFAYAKQMGQWITVMKRNGKDWSKVKPCLYDLSRFVEAQSIAYDSVLEELVAGRKETHWIWYIFPQIQGLGQSVTSRKYAIKNLDEAKEFLDHPVLGEHYNQCCRILLKHSDKSAVDIFGPLDALKVRSSITLFLRTGFRGISKTCRKILETFYNGEEDKLTLELLGVPAEKR